MASVINEWLKPPVFPEDENKTRVAHILHVILVVILGGTLASATFILGFIHTGIQNLVFLIPTIPLVAGLLHLLKRGYVHLSSLLFVFLAWFNLTVVISFGYGIQAVGILGYILIVIAACLLVNGKFAGIIALLNMASGIILLYLEKAGLLISQDSTQTGVVVWITQAFLSLLVTILLSLVLKSLQETLRHASISETYYKMLFEAAPNGILIVDEDNRIIMANAAVYQITGYSPDEVLGHSPFDFVASGDLIQMPPRTVDEMKTSGAQRRERVLLHKKGKYLNVIVSSSYMSDGRLQIIIQDITERKRIEEDLRASEEKFSKLFQSSPDAITLSRIDTGDFIEVNDAFVNLSGYTRSEVMKHSAKSLNIWADINDRGKMIEILLRGGEVCDFEAVLRRKNGEEVNALLSAEMIEIESQKCMVVIARDVTERKKMEEELSLSEERYRIISSVMSDYIFSNVQNENGEIVINWTAGALEQISGYTMDEFNARGGWVSTLHPDDLEQDAIDMEMLKNNQRVISEVRTIHKDGSIRWVRSYTHPVWDSNKNQLAGIYGAVQDITREKEAELERENLIGELKAKNAELEQFAYTISHDLKAPIITIRGFLGFLKADALAGNTLRLQKDIQRISEAADKMHKLLNDLLDLSRIGRVVNKIGMISFCGLVEKAREILQGRLYENNVEIIIDNALPMVYGDDQRLLEVVQNLIDNAAKFMGDQPNPRVEIGQCEMSENGFATLYVRDNGIGIEPPFHERIFGLFNRLNPDIEGTGIGLSLVKRIIEFHGGRIWVQSEAGKGAIFYFTLPTSKPNLG